MSGEAVKVSATRYVAPALPPLPYPGLRPFSTGEWQIYFGREVMADEVIKRLISRDLLVVHGESGCGKSSLIYAGVLPVLEQQSARSSFRWRTCFATPGDQPIRNLVDALVKLCPEPSPEREYEIRRALSYGPDSAAEVARLLRSGPDDHICILLDQFEELFAHARAHGPQEAEQIVEFLIGLHASRGDGLHAILTMRSEFLGACAQYRDFAETVNETQYLLPRMKQAELVRAIREPARLYGGEIELALAERLIEETGATQDQLPLIQHGLMKLHRVHQIESRETATRDSGARWTLTLKQYLDYSGSLAELLSKHASDVADRAEASLHRGTESPRVVENVFRALTTINSDGVAIRRKQTLQQLVAVTGVPQDQLRAVIDQFRVEGVSFLRPFGTSKLESDDLIDISHESLIRCWKRLSEWLIDEFRNGLIWQYLREQARNFDPKRPSYLPAATVFERERWLNQRNAEWAERYGGGWNEVSELVAASKRDAFRRERMTQWAAAILVGLLIVAVVLGLLARNAQIEADRAAKNAVSAEMRANDARDATARALKNVKAQAEVLEQFRAQNLSLTSELDRLKTAPTAGGGLKEQISAFSAQERDKLDAALAQLAPRVYLHITEESQRDAARRLAAKIGQLKFKESVLIAPGVQLVPAEDAPRKSELRCFTNEDCKDIDALAQVLQTVLATPQLALGDATKWYKGETLRKGHYELWFAPGRISLVGDTTTAELPAKLARALALTHYAPYCRVSEGKIVRCAFTDEEFCQHEVRSSERSSERCAARPGTIYCQNTSYPKALSSYLQLQAYATACYLTEEACSSNHDRCAAVILESNFRSLGQTGALDQTSVERVMKEDTGQWCLLYKANSRIAFCRFESAEDCNSYRVGQGGGSGQDCIEHPSALSCSYSGIFNKDGSRLPRCYPSESTCSADLAPRARCTNVAAPAR